MMIPISANCFAFILRTKGSGASATTLNVFDGKRSAVFLRDNLRAEERILGDFAIVDSAAYYTTYQEMTDEATADGAVSALAACEYIDALI